MFLLHLYCGSLENEKASIMVFLLWRQGLHFPICVDSSLRRGPRGREKARGRRAVASAAICCFTFQIMSCDRANGLLQSAKQYAEPCRSVSPAKCQNVTERFIAGQVEKVASPFFRECISHAMMCVLTLINHPLQHYSPWRLTPPGSFSSPPTHNAWRWIGFQHREKSVRNPEMSCG